LIQIIATYPLDLIRTRLQLVCAPLPLPLRDAESSLGDAKTSLGDAESSLGDAKSSLRDAESSLGDAKSSLGDAKSLLGGHAQAEQSGHKFKGIIDCGMSTYRLEGVRGMYKGLMPSMLAGVPYVGLQMTFYDMLKVCPRTSSLPSRVALHSVPSHRRPTPAAR
jgi:hypothetical protein